MSSPVRIKQGGAYGTKGASGSREPTAWRSGVSAIVRGKDCMLAGIISALFSPSNSRQGEHTRRGAGNAISCLVLVSAYKLRKVRSDVEEVWLAGRIVNQRGNYKFEGRISAGSN